MKLLQGDCLEVMKTIPDGSVDLVLCDPPYGITACKWDSVIDLELMWDQLKRIIKPNAAIVMTASQPFTTRLISSNYKMFKYCWVWDKVKTGAFAIAKYRPLANHEDICVFGSGRVNYYPIMVERDVPKKSKPYTASGSAHLKYNDGKARTYTHKYPKTILKVSNAYNTGKLHPTQKPVELMEYLVKTYSRPHDTVLDFCMGSGSTGVAAKNLDREFIGIELDPDYFEIAKNRLK